MGILNERIKSKRMSMGLTLLQVAEQLKVQEATVQRYESGEIKNIKHETITKLAHIFNCTPEYLMGWASNVDIIQSGEKKRRKGVKIPVLGYVPAGTPIEAVEDIIDYEEIDEDLASTGDFFALKIKGDSMEPRMEEGDVVIVRKQSTADNGDVVIALINGDDATCKKFKRTSDGIMLISTNPDYEPMYYSKKEVNNLPVIILGKVIELRGKFN